MSADESFLARWSRRKRGAAPKGARRTDAEGDRATMPPPEAAASLPPEETQPLLDPASLPPIESIGAGTDIRPFLAPGVPAELTRAALRRAWSADPAIRDFVGLSENSWDFNAPGGVPGIRLADGGRRPPASGAGDGEQEAEDLAHPAAGALSADQRRARRASAGQTTHRCCRQIK